MPRRFPTYGYGSMRPVRPGTAHAAAWRSRSRSQGTPARPRRGLAGELGEVIRLYRVWLLVAVVSFIIGYALGTWFGHDLAARAHLR